ncbi:MAG: GTPase/DUF3482 domain-containing protein [Desulfomonilia bacterium]
MTGSASVLTFAIVGHPNEGKSSVVSTLTEDDSVRITPIPGETTVCRTFPVVIDGLEIVRFVDTPGFQSPRAALAWLREHEGPDMLDSFLKEHCGDPLFSGECELFRPLSQGAGIIYVLDASRPLRSMDRAEMEILRMTGIPRMAVINSKEEDRSFIPQWRDELRKHFNSVRIFNAHRATYAERVALLESLKSIDQEWEPALVPVIRAVREDWRRRMNQTAWHICGMIETCLAHQISQSYSQGEDLEEIRRKLIGEYQDHIRDVERKTHLEIRRLFKHNIFDYRLPEQSIAGKDLFHEKTWRLLGLNPYQIAAAGAAAGTGIGLGIDAATAGISFGVFAVSGAILGAGSALVGGKRMVPTEIKGPKVGRFQMKKSLGDFVLIVGPNHNIQFPFVLLDRALIYFSHVINWAHGRRNRQKETPDTGPETFVARFTDRERKVCREFFQAAGAKDEARIREDRQPMLDMLFEVLLCLSDREYR